MLKLLRLKETSRRLRDGDWSAKNDLFCLGFFLFVEWGSVPAVGADWWFYIYKCLTAVLVYFCWEANKGERGTDFLRRFLALYRCHMLRIWTVFISYIVVMLSLGFLGCLLTGNIEGAFSGYCSESVDKWVGTFLDIHPFSPPVNKFLGGIGYFAQFQRVRDLVFWVVVALFWRSLYSSIEKVSTRKPLPALPAGSEPLSDLSE